MSMSRTEIFFQTILLNSSLADNIVNDDLRYIEWKAQPQAALPLGHERL